MAPNDINTSPENQEITSKAPETKKSGVLKSAMVATALLSTQVQASDLIAQCDYNNNGIVDGRTYLKGIKNDLSSDGDYSAEDKKIYKVALKNAKKERKCKKDIVKEEIAQQKIYLAQLDTSIENLKKELKNVEEEIRNNKEEIRNNKEEIKRKDKELERKRQRLIRAIREMAGRA